MKHILIRLVISVITIAVLSIYVLYLMENIPSIMNKEADKKDMKPIITEIKNTTIEKEEQDKDEIWKVVERSNSFNDELQFYSHKNIAIKDKSISIVTKKENAGLKNYTSGMVESKNAYLYGTFSFNIKVSEGKGIFPAIWFLPKANKMLPEIDVFEMIGSQPQKFYGVIHYGSANKRQRVYFSRDVIKKETYVVGIKWTKNEVSWYIDNKCVFRTNKGIPQEPMYLIINQAVGGNWAGKPNERTVFPAKFIISYYSLIPEITVER